MLGVVTNTFMLHLIWVLQQIPLLCVGESWSLKRLRDSLSVKLQGMVGQDQSPDSDLIICRVDDFCFSIIVVVLWLKRLWLLQGLQTQITQGSDRKQRYRWKTIRVVFGTVSAFLNQRHSNIQMWVYLKEGQQKNLWAFHPQVGGEDSFIDFSYVNSIQ